MALGDAQFQLVTFQLGERATSVDIMDVKEIVKSSNSSSYPKCPVLC